MVLCFIAKYRMLQIEDLVVVNLDEGVIQFPRCVEIASLPKHPASVFKDAVMNLLSHLDLWQLEMYAHQFN